MEGEGNIREKFIAFLKLNRVRAVDIASLSESCGQGYDDASTKRGHKSGVKARIREKQPNVLHTDCASHSL